MVCEHILLPVASIENDVYRSRRGDECDKDTGTTTCHRADAENLSVQPFHARLMTVLLKIIKAPARDRLLGPLWVRARTRTPTDA